MAIVKLQAKRTRDKYQVYMVTLPKELVEVLGWQQGDRIVVELHEKEGKRGLFLYKL